MIDVVAAFVQPVCVTACSNQAPSSASRFSVGAVCRS
jgi:hypothetical protein